MGAAKRSSGSTGRSGKGFAEMHAFFDRGAVILATSKAERAVLSKFGAYVMTTARHSIRKARRLRLDEMTKEQRHRWHQRGGKFEDKPFAPSKPGEPPRSRTGVLKSYIFFFYDFARHSVIIGPAQLPSYPRATVSVIEHGGIIRAGWLKGKFMAARPFMGPALQKELPGLAPLWANSVRPSV